MRPVRAKQNQERGHCSNSDHKGSPHLELMHSNLPKGVAFILRWDDLAPLGPVFPLFFSGSQPRRREAKYCAPTYRERRYQI